MPSELYVSRRITHSTASNKRPFEQPNPNIRCFSRSIASASIRPVVSTTSAGRGSGGWVTRNNTTRAYHDQASMSSLGSEGPPRPEGRWIGSGGSRCSGQISADGPGDHTLATMEFDPRDRRPVEMSCGRPNRAAQVSISANPRATNGLNPSETSRFSNRQGAKDAKKEKKISWRPWRPWRLGGSSLVPQRDRCSRPPLRPLRTPPQQPTTSRRQRRRAPAGAGASRRARSRPPSAGWPRTAARRRGGRPSRGRGSTRGARRR
ncbi:uncharacterized protein SOCE26_043200 [Sorangium cellulosum]|uniref:Uncharacterized protein n=1 Tax=Sorangium cellulosum TaxID=56 RepID=A0A2L0EUB0_SORCE|nr:uncharacterized protein SOCE26_043200 [Sorangium cellulosum]